MGTELPGLRSWKDLNTYFALAAGLIMFSLQRDLPVMLTGAGTAHRFSVTTPNASCMYIKHLGNWPKCCVQTSYARVGHRAGNNS